MRILKASNNASILPKNENGLSDHSEDTTAAKKDSGALKQNPIFMTFIDTLLAAIHDVPCARQFSSRQISIL